MQFFPNQSAFFGFSDSFFPISKKRMTRPLRATEGTVADKERNRERSKDDDAFSATHLWAMTTTFATTLCRLFHQSVVGFGKEFRFNLFKERTSSSSQRREEKSASNSFLFFRKTASSGGDFLRLAALVFARVELTKDVPRTTAPGGFLLCEQLRHHERKSDDARCEKKKVGAFKESSPSSFVEKSS